MRKAPIGSCCDQVASTPAQHEMPTSTRCPDECLMRAPEDQMCAFERNAVPRHWRERCYLDNVDDSTDMRMNRQKPHGGLRQGVTGCEPGVK
jgi:hypothetical protein